MSILHSNFYIPFKNKESANDPEKCNLDNIKDTNINDILIYKVRCSV